MTDGPLQWHPAFVAVLHIEFENELDTLEIRSEHLLCKKTLQIDVLIIKKTDDTPIHKNIGKIFRKHNFWLQNLRNDLKPDSEIRDILEKYEKKKQDLYYQAVMDLLVQNIRFDTY